MTNWKYGNLVAALFLLSIWGLSCDSDPILTEHGESTSQVENGEADDEDGEGGGTPRPDGADDDPDSDIGGGANTATPWVGFTYEMAYVDLGREGVLSVADIQGHPGYSLRGGRLDFPTDSTFFLKLDLPILTELQGTAEWHGAYVRLNRNSGLEAFGWLADPYSLRFEVVRGSFGIPGAINYTFNSPAPLYLEHTGSEYSSWGWKFIPQAYTNCTTHGSYRIDSIAVIFGERLNVRWLGFTGGADCVADQPDTINFYYDYTSSGPIYRVFDHPTYHNGEGGWAFEYGDRLLVHTRTELGWPRGGAQRREPEYYRSPE